MKASRKSLGLWAAMVVVLGFVPLSGLTPFYVGLIFLTMLYVCLTSSWNILGGWAGYLNLGHAGLFGVGAYVTSVLLVELGWSPFVTAPLAGIVVAAVAAGTGSVSLRLRGEYFAIVTLALGWILNLMIYNIPATGEGTGLILPSLGVFPPFTDPKQLLYEAMLVVMFCTVAASILINYSRFGLGIFAIREDEDAAASTGIPTYRYKILAYSLSAFFAGLAGGVFPFYVGYVSPTVAFPFTYTAYPVIMSLFGGVRKWFGPVVGAVLLYLLGQYLIITLQIAGIELVIVGAAILVVMTFLPNGLVSMIERRLIRRSKPPLAQSRMRGVEVRQSS